MDHSHMDHSGMNHGDMDMGDQCSMNVSRAVPRMHTIGADCARWSSHGTRRIYVLSSGNGESPAHSPSWCPWLPSSSWPRATRAWGGPVPDTKCPMKHECPPTAALVHVRPSPCQMLVVTETLSRRSRSRRRHKLMVDCRKRFKDECWASRQNG